MDGQEDINQLKLNWFCIWSGCLLLGRLYFIHKYLIEIGGLWVLLEYFSFLLTFPGGSGKKEKEMAVSDLFSSTSLWSCIPNGWPWISWTVPLCLGFTVCKTGKNVSLMSIGLLGGIEWWESRSSNAHGFIHKAFWNLISNWWERGWSQKWAKGTGLVLGLADRVNLPTVTITVSKGSTEVECTLSLGSRDEPRIVPKPRSEDGSWTLHGWMPVMLKFQTLCTSAKLTLRHRAFYLGWSKRIALWHCQVKWGKQQVLCLKFLSPNLLGVGEEFYSNSSREGLLTKIRVYLGPTFL